VTALTQYQRLEGTGIWHASAEEQRRDVILSLGDATLTITTIQGAPLSHWSLPALVRLNPGDDPPMYSPGGDSPEVLEVNDEDMISALEKVRKSVAKRTPKPGRVRWSLILAAIVITLLAGYIWLPQALIRQAAVVVPDAVRLNIGQALLAEITRFSGAPCTTTHGATALENLRVRLIPGWTGKIIIVPGGGRKAGHLPGGVIYLHRDLVEDFETPDVAAGYILSETTAALTNDPLHELLTHAGALEAGRLMVTGALSEATLEAEAEDQMLNQASPLPAGQLVPVFKAARLSTSPFARALDPSGETTLPLIEADPYPLGTPEALLSDTDFVALQAICGG
jgi:hypothetical protein